MTIVLFLLAAFSTIFAASYLILSMLRLGRESERIANNIRNEKKNE